ncbi:hypothetical protein ADK67_44215 [Saccharothrix sp. NRRL B-16348]|uniref:hypothetical protein n=1 Tax=Saccharothrix sp. NRRL B-16348 TaxID=1415542 RepID=UPI0006AEB26F|nr:hypothetical protein [Saccharothrix sp. NRRL B-16348]KOX13339.1 hypothetical protein ADK67_44215 [Saccharothrix sp. NRRL B-16348]
MAWKPDYVTVLDLADYRRVEDNVDNIEMQYAIAAASRAVERFCNRQFGSAAQTRYYTAGWDPALCKWVVDTDDIPTTTGLTVTYDSLNDGTYADAVTVYTLGPLNAVADGKPWNKIVIGATSPVTVSARVDAIKVVGTFGWTSVPTTIMQATLLQASRFLMRREAAFGIAGEGDASVRLLDRVDPDVAQMLRPYRKVWGAA